MIFTSDQIVDKINSSDIWMHRAFLKLIGEDLVLDHDVAWFVAIKQRSLEDLPSVLKMVLRQKLTSAYIQDIVEFANEG